MPQYESTGGSVVDKSKPVFDFRSDTVTRATPGMLQAMINCDTGDDVKGEDPTVVKLQKQMAALFGHEDALFVVSGCMGNQICLKAHLTEMHGQKDVVIQSVICDMRAHVFQWEFGGIAHHSQSQTVPIQVPEDQYLTAEIIQKYLFLDSNMHTPITTVISLESPLNGRIMPLAEVKKIRQLCDKHGIRLHLDGARIWNLLAALDVSPKEYIQQFHSMSACFSKGLGCPVGSIIVGSKSLISKATQYRKMFGGGWRQAGHLANAALYALDHHWPAMKKDHENAKLLAQGLKGLGFQLLHSTIDTNIVMVSSAPLKIEWPELEDKVHRMNQSEREIIKIESLEPTVARFVVHLQTPVESIHALLHRLSLILNKSKL